MVKSNQSNHYKFVTKDIGYVVKRKPDPNWSINNLINDKYSILALAINGKAKYNLKNKNCQITKGDLLFFPKGTSHTASSDKTDPWSFYVVTFSLDFNNKKSKEHLYSLNNFFNRSNTFKLYALFSELHRMWSGKKPGYLIRCQSILLEILYLMIRETNFSANNIPHSHKIEKIMDLIQENYTKSYSIKELSNNIKLSSSYFRKLFKKTTGLTVIQYKNKIKINKAKDLLLCGDYNVTEASREVGFDNIYYFSKLFKKITGVNPSEYLKK